MTRPVSGREPRGERHSTYLSRPDAVSLGESPRYIKTSASCLNRRHRHQHGTATPAGSPSRPRNPYSSRSRRSASNRRRVPRYGSTGMWRVASIAGRGRPSVIACGHVRRASCVRRRGCVSSMSRSRLIGRREFPRLLFNATVF